MQSFANLHPLAQRIVQHYVRMKALRPPHQQQRPPEARHPFAAPPAANYRQAVHPLAPFLRARRPPGLPLGVRLPLPLVKPIVAG
jgi:hypothetical protein